MARVAGQARDARRRRHRLAWAPSIADPGAIAAAWAARRARHSVERSPPHDHRRRPPRPRGPRRAGQPPRDGLSPDLLGRLAEALARPGVDGVLGTADVLEDLLLMGCLDGLLVIGSMNRGGLQGASFELDDRFTAYDAATITPTDWTAARS
jgi:hypothetical protein